VQQPHRTTTTKYDRYKPLSCVNDLYRPLCRSMVRRGSMGKQCDAIVLRTNCSTVPRPSLKACPINGRDHLSSYQSYSQDAATITSVYQRAAQTMTCDFKVVRVELGPAGSPSAPRTASVTDGSPSMSAPRMSGDVADGGRRADDRLDRLRQLHLDRPFSQDPLMRSSAATGNVCPVG
jgi:hypothetical protein